MAYYPLMRRESEGGAVVAVFEGNHDRDRRVIQTDPYLREWRWVRGGVAR
jgi:hypothetical protein